MIVAATTTVPVAWLVARAAGLTALTLLSCSVWLGLAMSGACPRPDDATFTALGTSCAVRVNRNRPPPVRV